MKPVAPPAVLPIAAAVIAGGVKSAAAVTMSPSFCVLPPNAATAAGIAIRAIAPTTPRTAAPFQIRLADATDRAFFVWPPPRPPDPHELLTPDQEQRDADEGD